MWKREYQQRYRRFMIENSSQERRRFWVVVMYAGLAGWTIYSLTSSLPSLKGIIPPWTFYVVTISCAAIGALGFLVTVSTSTYVSRGLEASANPQEKKLDEREQKVWGRASRKAYLVILGILLVTHIYWAFVWPLFGLLEKGIMGLLSLAIFLLALSLPNAIVAWTEPDAEE